MYECNEQEWSKMATLLLSYKENEKKTLIKEEKKERKRTACTKNESNVRPTFLFAYNKSKSYLFNVFNIYAARNN